MIRTARRVLGWRTPVGPGRAWVVGLVVVLALLVVGFVAARRALLGADDPARTLSSAAAIAPQRLRLPTPLEAAWAHSLDVADAAGADWNHLLQPPLPPPLCAPGGAATDGQELNLAIRRLDRALARADSQPRLADRALDDLAARAAPGAGLEPFLVDYNAARAQLAMGDASAAARTLAPQLDDGYVGDDAVPHTVGTDASYRLQRGQTTPERALLAYHARVLAADAALRRGEPYDAILHLRRGINALHYVIAGRGTAVRGHYQQMALEPGPYACGGDTASPLTSMDGYAALVLAYLETEDFRNPRLVAGEVRRGRFEMESNDPLAPLIEYAQDLAPDLGAGPIPSNFVWAASNLQRVYHNNRRAPDPRLEVARAVLIFRVASNPAWLRALDRYGSADPCRMLYRLTRELAASAGRARVRGPAPAPSDSALAAVGVLAFARTRAECGAAAAPSLPDDVRSAWLLRSGRYLGGGLIADYEERRVDIADVLSRGMPAGAGADLLDEPLERTAAHLAAFRAGRTPPELPASIDPEQGRRLVEAWQRGLFRDAADGLLAAARGEADAKVPLRLTTDAFPRFHRTLDAAIRHAGLTPADLYPASEFDDLARAGGRLRWLRYAVVYRARSNPTLTTLVLLVGLAAAGFAVLFLHVNLWRFRLLTRRRFYAEGLE